MLWGCGTWSTCPRPKRKRSRLPRTEIAALINADAKLRSLGPRLGYPHSSAVRGAPGLRELRPRSGRSRWRAFYRQVGDRFIVAAVGAEAQVDQRGFDRSCQAALDRLPAIEDEEG
jgi:hypothetical protein